MGELQLRAFLTKRHDLKANRRAVPIMEITEPQLFGMFGVEHLPLNEPRRFESSD